MRVFLISVRASVSAFASSRVLSGQKETRSVPISSRLGRPVAAKTWLGLPLWQADPEDTQIPLSLNSRTSISLG